MPGTIKKKIIYYSFQLHKKRNQKEFADIIIFDKVIQFILSKQKIDRKYEIRGQNKAHFLKSYEKKDSIATIVFQTAKHHYKPDLLNTMTGDERENPKDDFEGDNELTHFSLRYDIDENEIVCIKEEKRSGISIGAFIDYFHFFSKSFFSENKSIDPARINYSFIQTNNFLDNLERLKVTTEVKLRVESDVLGSEFLNFSNHIDELNDTILIDIKASRDKNMVESIKDYFYEKMSSTQKKIKKIRVYGIDEEQNNIMIDTEIFKRTTFIEVETDIKGVAKSNYILKQMSNILENFYE